MNSPQYILHPAGLTIRAIMVFSIVTLLSAGFALAQGTLTNGYTHEASIAPVGNLDVWTFSANAGDRIVIRAGEISQTNTLNVRLTLLNPDGVQIATISDSTTSEIAVTATNTGVFTLNVDDVNSDATGIYRLTLAKSPGAIFVAAGDEGGVLTNGYAHTGSLPVGDLDVWSFEASSGDQIMVRTGRISGGNAFNPSLRVYGPNGVLVGSDLIGGDTSSAEVLFAATNTGAFTVVVHETSGTTGDYRVTLAKSLGSIFVAPGDEGGPLTNGYTHTAALPTGDLDVWSFEASSGDQVLMRTGRISGGNAFNPALRVFGPNGLLVGSDLIGGDTSTAEVLFAATNTGAFTVVVNDTSGTTGDYRVTLVRAPGAIFVVPGDEGGQLTNELVYVGSIEVGDLDVWTFTACAGDALILQIAELTGSVSFAPTLRLFAPNGLLTNTNSGASSAQISRMAPLTGTYTLVVGDNTGSSTGTYQLTGAGISTGFILCRPLISGANVVIRSAGGPANSNYVLFYTRNVALPFNEWTPIHTNQFSAYGEFSVTNLFSPTVPHEFFRVRTP